MGNHDTFTCCGVKLCFIVFILLLVSPPATFAQLYNDYLGAGHNDGVTVTGSSSELSETPDNTLDGFNLIPDRHQASRFLAQATFGANYETIDSVVQLGADQWLDQQFALPPSYMQDLFDPLANAFSEDSNALSTFTGSWWHTIVTADDQLRQRVAYALSQILVLSYENRTVNPVAAEIGSYYDLLVQHAFGNYRDLLMDITLHPSMSDWLTYYNNPKTDTSANIYPDENYAREIMQLFTIGLYELNLDGTRKLDGNGNPIPTYDNDDIQEMAKVFTGLGASDLWEWVNLNQHGYDQAEFGIPYRYCHQAKPLAMYDHMHEPGEKHLLNGFVIPAGQTGMEDLEMAIDHLFNHPNVGPFLAYRLIQRLVKSNPSPEYIERVATVFNDNGQGVRGDLQAVVRAILLDPEARDCSFQQDDANGRLKEVILRYTQLLRGFDIYNDQGWFVRTGFPFNQRLLQNVMGSQTVFNFYQPNFAPIGGINDAGLVAPEYQIHNATTSINFANWANDWTVDGDPFRIYQFGSDVIDSHLDLSDEIALVSQPEVLMERLNVILCHGQMSPRTKRIIIHALDEMKEVHDPTEQVQLALFLTLIAPDCAVMR